MSLLHIIPPLTKSSRIISPPTEARSGMARDWGRPKITQTLTRGDREGMAISLLLPVHDVMSVRNGT